MVPNIARDASINKIMAVLCQEFFGFPGVTRTLSPLYGFGSRWGYWAFAKLRPRCLTNSFILRFAALSWIRHGHRLIFALAVGLEARRLDSRSLPQSRPDGHMAKENRRQLHQTHRSLEAKDPCRWKLSGSPRSRMSSRA